MPRKASKGNIAPTPGTASNVALPIAPQGLDTVRRSTHQTDPSKSAGITANGLVTVVQQEGTGQQQTRQTAAKATSSTGVETRKEKLATKAAAAPRKQRIAPSKAGTMSDKALLGTTLVLDNPPSAPTTEVLPPPQTLANVLPRKSCSAAVDADKVDSGHSGKKREPSKPSAKENAKAKRAKANERIEELQDEVVQQWKAYEENDQATVARETMQAIHRLSDVGEISLADFGTTRLAQNSTEDQASDMDSSEEEGSLEFSSVEPEEEQNVEAGADPMVS